MPAPIVNNDVEEFKRYLREMLDRADKTVSAESLRALMWKHFLPEALHFWTTAGVLEQIAALIAESSNDEEEPNDE